MYMPQNLKKGNQRRKNREKRPPMNNLVREFAPDSNLVKRTEWEKRTLPFNHCMISYRVPTARCIIAYSAEHQTGTGIGH